MTCFDYDPDYDEISSDDGIEPAIKRAIRAYEQVHRCRTILHHAFLQLNDRELPSPIGGDEFLPLLVEARQGDLSSKRRRVEAVKEAVRSLETALTHAQTSVNHLDRLTLRLDQVDRATNLRRAAKWMDTSINELLELCERSMAVESGAAA